MKIECPACGRYGIRTQDGTALIKHGLSCIVQQHERILCVPFDDARKAYVQAALEPGASSNG